MTQNHPTYPFAGRILKGRFGADSAVPEAKAERPVLDLKAVGGY